MKRVGIYVGYYYNNWDEKSVEDGIGGSETWAIEVAKRLSEFYEVIVYAQPWMDHYVNKNLKLVEYTEYLEDIKKGIKFDYFIFSRVTDVIHPYLKCDNVYVMVHDVCCKCQYSIGLGRVKKYGYLSEWHKNNLLEVYKGLSSEFLLKVSNGFSRELYDEYINIPKENSMVWSSSITRGFFDIYNSIITEVIKEIPDFKVHLCSGTIEDLEIIQLLQKAQSLPNVIVHGRLSKKKLAELQCKSKVWIYPGTFRETFCITAIENAYAGNCIIAPGSYGLATTLLGYKGFELLGYSPFTRHNNDYIIKMVINALNDDESIIPLINSSKSIATQYSWERATNEWIEEFKRSDEDII
jgi:glycosyltransferase involved in cell wall biosynthesis